MDLFQKAKSHLIRYLVTFGNTTIDHAFDNVLKVYDVARGHILSRGGPDPHTIYPNLFREKPTLVARGATGPIEGGVDVAEYFVSVSTYII